MIQSGIYKIQNLITDEVYVGSSINLEKRKYEHFRLLKRNTHSNKHLQSSYNKHGERVFVFEMLKECEKDECIYWEQYFIDYLSPIYNINPIAGSSLNVKHTKETIEKIRKSKMGHFVSEETKEKISEKLKGRIGQKWQPGRIASQPAAEAHGAPHAAVHREARRFRV